MIQRLRRVTLPLAVLAGGSTALAALVAAGTAAAALAVAHHLDRTTVYCLLVALASGLLPTVVAGYGAHRLAGALRRLNREALRRLAEPASSWPTTGRVIDIAGASAEFAALSRTLDALALRVRVADEVAARQRRSAETASAGMFELLSGLVAAEEGTRGQLSAELHDTVAQSLMLSRTLLSDVLATAADAPAQLERAADYVAEAEDQVRAVMARTRPPGLRDGDLALAVATLRDDMHSRYGLTVHVSWPAEAYPVSLVAAVTVYRFFQEALLNVVKHADVDAARLRLIVADTELVASVRDDGPGFDPATVRPERGRHVGLGLLRERVRLAGGSVTVSSAPGAGTTLTLRLPRTAGGAALQGSRGGGVLSRVAR